MSVKRLSRRALLRGAGGVAIALPALDIMRPSSLLSPLARSKAKAQMGAAPKRYLVSYIGVSTGKRVWPNNTESFDLIVPDREGLGYDVKRAVQPFADHEVRDDISLVTGLRVPWGATAPAGGRVLDFHGSSVVPQIAGTRAHRTGAIPSAPTSDWIVAPHIAGDTRIPNLTLRVQAAKYAGGGEGITGRLSWREAPDGSITAVDPFVNPGQCFQQLFGGFAPDAETADPIDGLRRMRRRSVVDVVRQQTDRLSSRLGREDSVRLRQHLAEIRSLERRLESVAPSPSMMSSCEVPTDPGESWPVMPGKWSNEDVRAETLIDLIHLAWACDLNRVTTLQLNFWKSWMNIPSLGVGIDFHQMTHEGPVENLSDGIAFHLEYFARLVDKLKNTPDIDGRSMLDNSVLTNLFEGGHGADVEDGLTRPDSHSTERMVAIVAGRAGGLVSGQHIRATGRHPAQVLISAMNAVGRPEETLGEVEGRIDELFQVPA